MFEMVEDMKEVVIERWGPVVVEDNVALAVLELVGVDSTVVETSTGI